LRVCGSPLIVNTEQTNPARPESLMIRPYEDRDLDALLAVWEAASAIAHPFLSEEFTAQERKNIPELYIPNTDTWIYEEAGRVAGFLALMQNEIGAIFVHPESQRRGAGHALTDKARSLHETLEVEVFERNSIGRGFYAKYGFEEMSRRTHEDTGFELLRLRWAPQEKTT
jgi:putative acetyltransferase